MVFLRKHGYTSVGVTFLLGAFTISWYQLVHGFWMNLFADAWNYVPISVPTLVMGDFCAAAVLITFGVVLGKVSPSQMLFVALSETVFYSLNEAIGIRLAVSDLGGTMTIHVFAAFFGLALSTIISRTNALVSRNSSHLPFRRHGDGRNGLPLDTLAVIQCRTRCWRNSSARRH